MRDENIKEGINHIKNLTNQKEKYQGESPWNNVRGWYIHPFITLEMVAIKKNEDSDYKEYYEFLKETIFKFLDNNIELKNRYFFIEEFHG